MDKTERLTFKKIRYLKGIKHTQMLIESRERDLRATEERKRHVKAIDYAKEQVKGGNKNSWESLIDKSDKLKRYIIDQNAKLIDMKLEIMKSIDDIDDIELRLLLQLKYIECKDWNEVEYMMNLETNTRVNKHSQALSKIRIKNLFKST